MATTNTKLRPVASTKRRRSGPLSTSAYERASGLLIALLLTIGFVVLLMVLMWLSRRFTFKRPVVEVTVMDTLGGGGSGAGSPGPSQTLDEVTPDEVADLQETPIEKSLNAISLTVSEQPPNLEAMVGATGLGHGEGSGMGDGRGPGPGGPGTLTELPDWEVRFNASSLEEYAKQLDYFNIELAAVGGGKTIVDYASKLSHSKPTTRRAEGAKENRRYLLWRKGALEQADRALIKKAGIEASGRVLLQFLSPETEQRMAALEAAHAKGKKVSQIRRTVFGVKANGGKYEFFVIEQNYRG